MRRKRVDRLVDVASRLGAAIAKREQVDAQRDLLDFSIKAYDRALLRAFAIHRPGGIDPTRDPITISIRDSQLAQIRSLIDESRQLTMRIHQLEKQLARVQRPQ